MTIEELEAVCKQPRDDGLDGTHEVRIYYPHNIVACVDSQVRKVQVYESDGTDRRNKFLLLASVDISDLSNR